MVFIFVLKFNRLKKNRLGYVDIIHRISFSSSYEICKRVISTQDNLIALSNALARREISVKCDIPNSLISFYLSYHQFFLFEKYALHSIFFQT